MKILQYLFLSLVVCATVNQLYGADPKDVKTSAASVAAAASAAASSSVAVASSSSSSAGASSSQQVKEKESESVKKIYRAVASLQSVRSPEHVPEEILVRLRSIVNPTGSEQGADHDPVVIVEQLGEELERIAKQTKSHDAPPANK